jgi:hypothetical protein
MKAAQPFALIKGDTPTIPMRTGATTALHQTSKAETDIRRHIGTHAK